MKVYEAINAVQAALSKEGISKTQKNAQQGYQFRGIDDVMNALAPILVQSRLCILPRVMARETTERQSKSGSALFYTVLDMEYDFVHAEDASKHVVSVVGEAMDSADKSCNKAMSAAYKYACIQAFCIPTEGDADATTHEVAAAGVTEGPAAVAPTRHATPSQQRAAVLPVSSLTPPQNRSVASGNGADLKISEKQAIRYHAKARDAGWKDPELAAWLLEVWGLHSSRDIPRAKYDEICKQVEQGMEP